MNEIRELVFNGGGARGVGMPGVYYALKHTRDINDSKKSEQCVFDGVKTIAGTSVGSLTACLFSMGPTNKELKDFVADKNLLEVLGMNKVLVPLFLSLGALESFINDYFRANILQFFEKLDAPLTPEMTILSENLKNNEYALTFQDLFNLNQNWPNKFKNLIITSTIAENGHSKLVLHNQLNTPDSSIASACLASCAIYPIFNPVSINNVMHYDGGCSEPLPSEYFCDSNETKSRLLFVFGPGPSMLGNIWKKTLFHSFSPKLTYIEDASVFSTKEQDESQIFIYIDNQNKMVNYKTSKVSSSISFSQLNIPEGEDIFNFEPHRVEFYTQLVKRGEMESILGNYSIIWILDYFAILVQLVYGFKIYIATLFESLCQRLRTFYSCNTVVLNSVLQGASFHYAETIKETVEATYFLETMNHLCQYNYLNTDASEFYTRIFNMYVLIENTFLKAKKLPPKSYANKNISNYYYEWLDEATQNPESSCAFILTLAVQFYLGHLKDDEDVLKAINSRAQNKSLTYFEFFTGRQYEEQKVLVQSYAEDQLKCERNLN